MKFDERANLGRAEPWLRAVGLAIWAFVGLTQLAWKPWLIPWLAYGVAFLALIAHARFPRWLSVTLLVVQSASVLTLPRLGLNGFEGLLLSIVIIQVPIVLSLRHAISWAAGHVVPLCVAVYPYNDFRHLMDILGASSAFAIFVLFFYWIHLQERRARAELATTNAALLDTRAMLVEGSRQTERLRISRELHDSLGHHLTALSLQLELAQRLAQGGALEPVTRAREISRDSLTEVRNVVSQLQASQPIELVASLRALASGIPAPRIVIQAPGELAVADGEASHVLFRCVQEAITNCLKHASAQTIWVELRRVEPWVDVVVRDDGRGVKQVQAGHGLKGMQARVAQVKGHVEFESSPGRGFQVHLQVPAGTAG